MKEFKDSQSMQELCQLTYDMWLHGWDEYNGGNVSYILPEEDREYLKIYAVKKEVELSDIPPEMIGQYVLITASGSHFRTLRDHVERDTGVIRVTEAGYQVLWGFEEEKRPTSELYMHLLAHAKRLSVDPAHRVVVHNHAPNATAYSLVSPPDDKEYTLPLWRVLTESIVVFPDGVGILPWELPGTLAIAQHSVEKLEHCRIVVWAYHGILATGKDFQDCFGLIETVDKAAKIHLQTMSIKQYPGLSDKDLYEVCQVLKVEPREGFLQI
ncbi:rhamnulose-1-phosphate aldolase [Streptococcus suis]|uniref:Rhamnulose-1-phosphate aldolase n=1 Tax=Streptococcus suis TaxID=1307 RepID=A0A116QWN6_STRSU|nr:rhamnulose-1-phosphate aldolase [Streptococcus suis]MDW8778467.1 rhamnulose-1-phosphate aldolase [Streptococcus suis]NQK50496.1 rhamnulose-1-phosphate aldolase [Streptococcus suis]NQM50510.1 rhamnulose-1-phosphate aldolase [Streptococcus suis]NQR95608.1 rhamnulose-1-phosphate aldolase [Streptococcus suis]CYX35727.1 rhamnulose-1-phosphate aldolase [Streptococcus suis]